MTAQHLLQAHIRIWKPTKVHSTCWKELPGRKSTDLKVVGPRKIKTVEQLLFVFWLIWNSVLNRLCIFISNEKILSTHAKLPLQYQIYLAEATRPWFLLVSCLSSMALVSSLCLWGQEGHLMWSVKSSMFKHTVKVNNVEKVNRKKTQAIPLFMTQSRDFEYLILSRGTSERMGRLWDMVSSWHVWTAFLIVLTLLSHQVLQTPTRTFIQPMLQASAATFRAPSSQAFSAMMMTSRNHEPKPTLCLLSCFSLSPVAEMRKRAKKICKHI